MLHRVLTAVIMIGVLVAGSTIVPMAASAQTLTPTQQPGDTLTPVPTPGSDGLTPAVPTATPPPGGPTVPGGATVQQTPGAWVVSGVRVDVTGSSTAAAREQAFTDGRRLAFGSLIDFLGVSRTQLDPSDLSDQELSRLTRGFSVEQESTTPGRYMASLSYIFRPDAVREVFQERAVTTLQPAGPMEDLTTTTGPGSAGAVGGQPVLVLPVFRQGGTARLWDSPNPWREAWQNVDGGDRFVVPFGDLEDVADVDVEAATRGDAAAFRAIADRYGAGDTVVAVAQPNGEAVSVSLTRHSSRGPGTTQILTVQGGTWQAAVQEAIAGLDGAGTRPQLTEMPPGAVGAPAAFGAGPPVGALPSGTVGPGGLAVLVPLSSPRDWFDIRRRLSQVVSLTGVQIVSLASDEAVLRLGYLGDESQLRSGLAAEGLNLTQGAAAPELRRAGPAN